MSLFEPGMIVMTSAIEVITNASKESYDIVEGCLDKHLQGNWGDLCDDDKKMNDDALEQERNGLPTDRLFSMYSTDVGVIYVITEYDRSVTTILTPEDY